MENGRSPVPPFPVDTGTYQDWDEWKKTLEFYFTAEKVTDPAIKQAKLILYGGKDMQKMYYSFPIVTKLPDNADLYTYTIECFDSKLGKETSKWFERYQLTQIRQGKDEKFASFLLRLQSQAQKCDFNKDLVDEAVQLQIIVGCFSAELLKELFQTKAKTKLKEFEEIARVLESVTAQSAALQSPAAAPPSSAPVNKVSEKKKANWRKKQTAQPSTGNDRDKSSPKPVKIECYCCGKDDHLARDPKCPAKKATCGKCGKVGHYRKCCMIGKSSEQNASKNVVKTVSNEPIFCINSSETTNSDELVPCVFGGVNCEMFVDSGSSYTIVSYDRWRKMRKHKDFSVVQFVSKPNVNFVDGSGQVSYKVRLSALVEIACNDHRCIAEVIVVNEEMQLLLGRDDAKALGVLRVGLDACSNVRIKAVSSSKPAPLGLLKDFELEIPIDENVTPVIQPMYRVPIGLRPAVEKCINELLELDVIELVTEASRWVSPIILEPKGEDDYRLCVDMRRANEAVLMEKHPIPTMEDFEPEITDARVFSKIDLRWAYRQILMSKKSRLNCAAEKYQKILEAILAGCKALIYIDDIVVYGKDQAEHDANLKAVLSRLRECGLEINMQKSKFGQSEVTFLGHVIGNGTIRPTLNKVQVIQEFRLPESGKFIPNLSSELDLLRQVARTTPFSWSPEAVQHFIHIQSMLSEESYLYLFDPELPTTVMADASPGYKYRVRYAPGKNNIADPLSRLLEVGEDVVTGNEGGC
ncbi:uncharacterized protein LOC135847033 [Planococcus citri]|uniref:uncharacterized protein LOC135847033 n=1 Tax=Planococcus citri TaxID=170843 RepID=UPI0031F83FB9